MQLPLLGGVELAPAETTSGELFPNAMSGVYLVTAWNPGATLLSLAENVERHEALVGYLDASRVEHWEAAGYSPDLSWVELGLALPGVSEDQALEVGRRFGQLALFAWRERELAVLACADGARLASYGWSARPRARPPNPPGD